MRATLKAREPQRPKSQPLCFSTPSVQGVEEQNARRLVSSGRTSDSEYLASIHAWPQAVKAEYPGIQKSSFCVYKKKPASERADLIKRAQAGEAVTARSVQIDKDIENRAARPRARAVSFRLPFERNDFAARLEPVQIVRPPLRHFNPLFPERAARIGPADRIGVLMRQGAFNRNG